MNKASESLRSLNLYLEDNMILTVTLNPCIDKTAVCHGFNQEKVNRITPVAEDFGGKGINVSRALKKLGYDTFALGIGFDKAEDITEFLGREGINSHFIKTGGRLRTNLKIFDEATSKTVEINENSASVYCDEITKLLEEYVAELPYAEIVVLSGSLPDGVPLDMYKILCNLARKVNPDVKLVVDTQGKALIEALDEMPYLIKPNEDELRSTFAEDCETDIKKISDKIIAYGLAEVVLTSMGGDGAMIVTQGECFKHAALKVDVKSAQGAGDAMVAGACAAIYDGKDIETTLKYGIAAATGAVTKQGTDFCDQNEFKTYLEML